MGELLGALVAIPFTRRISIAGPYVNVVWPSAVVHQPSGAFPRAGSLLRTLEALAGSYRLFDSLTVLLIHRTDGFVKQAVNRSDFGQVWGSVITCH
jgi:hypothetical protein